MKIIYLTEGMYNSGGMERMITLKANWLAQNSPHNVTILTFAQKEDQCDYFPLDPKVNRIRLDIDSQNFQKDLHTKLSRWLQDNPQDICISTYGREFGILPTLKDQSKKIVEFHFSYDINKQWASKNGHSLPSKLRGMLGTIRMTRTAKQYDKIVVLTNSDFRKWHHPKVTVINNPVTITPESTSDCTPKRIIALGRMDRQKGFDYLIECWKTLEKKYPEWKLDIYGSGNATPYTNLIHQANLQNICIHPQIKDVVPELLKSSIYVLSSRYEGFGLVVVEAMSCGLPIVTFDCPSGPAEIVKNGVNGFIVAKVGDTQTMATQISRLIEDATLRKEFGKQSKALSQQYSLDATMNKWVNLFKEITDTPN